MKKDRSRDDLLNFDEVHSMSPGPTPRSFSNHSRTSAQE
jgi:hypothetical protein